LNQICCSLTIDSQVKKKLDFVCIVWFKLLGISVYRWGYDGWLLILCFGCFIFCLGIF